MRRLKPSLTGVCSLCTIVPCSTPNTLACARNLREPFGVLQALQADLSFIHINHILGADGARLSDFTALGNNRPSGICALQDNFHWECMGAKQ